MDERIKLIIACEALRAEIEAAGELGVDIIWLQQALHDDPDKLHEILQEAILKAEAALEDNDMVLLFLGKCGGALRGVSSVKLHLVHPDVEDCIPIIIGSMEQYLRLQKERPRTFYLNKAWIDSGQDPLSSNKKYLAAYGEKKGWRISQALYKNYNYFTLIDNGCYDLTEYRAYVQETCQRFEKTYQETLGTLDYIKAILNLKCPMIHIPPCKQSKEAKVYQSRAAFFPKEIK